MRISGLRSSSPGSQLLASSCELGLDQRRSSGICRYVKKLRLLALKRPRSSCSRLHKHSWPSTWEFGRRMHTILLQTKVSCRDRGMYYHLRLTHDEILWAR
ncbi:hypothetical protein MPTK1_5g06640 [Marchantia polymorpha subsp. ruderalis]|uniref:Uncharacterized protein n=2 Tax=Marchantia polymorpha TaxID=3197 RepID=A0AAF6BFN1_MARPO|nr:hypothetical protein MARPO_0171s0019 [Marchantia polymorpha]BBN10815.1 hypothetical protein Mp_5g06640 [Marchantia polymorpha subsp. ruderalis]|eukprot:PTQ28177.1 hypothetical protein MARPO_0171s0019 [Marchantia polymorpha]